ncbi:MAG: hypothetical protein HQL54_07185 [Magnetococcales bacterium]|nr:hypothetical protein [Magnetococcales bacterium]
MNATGSVNDISVYDPNAIKYEDTEADAEQMRIDFLTMLTAQLEFQDPLEPMENTDLTAQMAQFSSLEEQQRGNSLLEKLLNAQGASQMNNAVSYIGRQVMAEGNGLQVDGGAGDLAFDLNSPAMVGVTVYDEAGSPVKIIEGRPYESGEHRLDINNPALGESLPDGNYTFSVTVAEAADSGARATPLEVGVVKGVRQSGDGDVELDLNGRSVQLSQVRRVELAGS